MKILNKKYEMKRSMVELDSFFHFYGKVRKKESQRRSWCGLKKMQEGNVSCVGLNFRAMTENKNMRSRVHEDEEHASSSNLNLRWLFADAAVAQFKDHEDRFRNNNQDHLLWNF